MNTVNVTSAFMSEKEIAQTQIFFNLVKKKKATLHLSLYLWPLCLISNIPFKLRKSFIIVYNKGD